MELVFSRLTVSYSLRSGGLLHMLNCGLLRVGCQGGWLRGVVLGHSGSVLTDLLHARGGNRNGLLAVVTA